MIAAPPTVAADMAVAAGAAEQAGVRRVTAVAWRDLDHPDAGGSEVHLDEVLGRWAAAGLDVRLHTARVVGAPPSATRRGYTVERRGGPVTGLLRNPVRARAARGDATVEAWHGINFCGPLWIRGPRLAIVHHVHAPEFHYVLPRPAAWAARRHEGTVSPRIYRRTPIVALSPSVRADLVALGYDPDLVTAVPPGVSSTFSPGGTRSPTPRVLTVCRLWPVKKVEVLVRAVADLRERHPGIELVVVGDGPCRPALAALVEQLRAPVRLLGRVDDVELIDLYRSAWVLASASEGEGWGMTVTEAAACGTPAVVVDNAGHRHSVVHEVTGLLASGPQAIASALDRVLGDVVLRARLGRAARARARDLTWDRTAAAMLDVLVADALRRRPAAVAQPGRGGCPPGWRVSPARPADAG